MVYNVLRNAYKSQLVHAKIFRQCIPAAAAVVNASVGAAFSMTLMDRALQKVCMVLPLHTPEAWHCTGNTALPSNDSPLLNKAVQYAWIDGLISK